MAINLDVRNIDTNNDGSIDKAEWNKWYEANKTGLKDPTTSIQFTNKYGETKQYTLKQLQEMQKNGKLATAGDPKVPEKLDKEGLEKLQAKITTYDTAIDEAKKEKAALQAKLDGKAALEKGETKATVKKALETIKNKLKALKKQQKQFIKSAEAQAARKGEKSKFLTKKIYQNADMSVPKELAGKQTKSSAKTTLTQGKAQTTGNSGTPKSGKGTTGTKAQTTGGFGNLPSNWGAQTASGPQVSSAAYAQSLFMEDNMMNAWDSINSNTNRGQKLMQVLFYYQRMAMSGDLTAMYNMMKAVLYIVSKDKALQQVNMANKLIELQDASRKATDKLMNFKTDPNDPNSQNDFTKQLQETKSESDTIATSQKLVAQMMEEMAQIVETLTNVTKGALDAAGRVMRTVSRFS